MSGENTTPDIGCGTGSGTSEIGRPDMGLASDASVDTLAPADGRRGLPGRPVPHGRRSLQTARAAVTRGPSQRPGEGLR